MTKPVSRKMAVDCLLWYVQQPNAMTQMPVLDGTWFRTTISCYICGEPCLPGQAIQFDHIHADIHSGPHEYQNLRPVHYDPCHKKKSAKDVKANAKVKRLRGETKGRPKRSWPTRKMKSAKKP